MAQSNGDSPNFSGPVSAQHFSSTLFQPVAGTYTQLNLRAIPQTVALMTNGTTQVNVFGTTNPISGTFIAARIMAKDDANGNITLQHTSAGTTVFTIAKGSAGAVKGSYFAATSFAINGTATVKSSTTTGNAYVEIDFIPSNPALPGAQ